FATLLPSDLLSLAVRPCVQGDRRPRRLGAGEARRAGTAAGHAHREVAGRGGAAVVVDHVLDDDEMRRLVVVGDRAGLRLPDGDRTGAVGREAGGITAQATLYHGVRARVEGDRRPRRPAPRQARRARAAAGHAHREVAGRLGPAVVVHHVLDDDELRLDVVI